jgi:predicted peptidase
MKKVFISVICFLFTVYYTKGQDTSLYEKHYFIQGTDTMPYRVLLPVNYNQHKKYPLILFLHGAGERGNDNIKQLVHGADLFLKDSIRKNYPAIVVFPQCASESFWSNISYHYDSVAKKGIIEFREGGEPTRAMKLLMNLFTQLENNYALDKARLYVGGLSMGGMGTFELTRRIPDTFASAFAICGGADTATAKKISNTAWRIFHGLKDNVVDPRFSIDMAAALKANGAEVLLKLYPDDGHNSWDDAFKEPDFFSWMFSHKQKIMK